MTKEELLSLTIEQLNEMTEEQLDVVANEVVSKLADYEIEEFPSQVKEKLGLKRESLWRSKSTWITLIISALVMSVMQVIFGR